MKELKLNNEQTNGFLIMTMLAKLSKQCIDAENHPIMAMSTFTVYATTECPSGSRGVIIDGKYRLMAEVLGAEMTGWVGAVKCKDFRTWLKKTYNDTPESLLEAMSGVTVRRKESI